MKKYLIFSVNEYKQRIEKARRLMEAQNIEVCIFSKAANIIYFSGYLTTLYDSDFRPFLFVLPLNKDPILIVPDLEMGGAQKTSWINDIRVWGNTKRCVASNPISLLVLTLKGLKLDRAKIGIELGNGQRLGMTLQQFDELKKDLSGIDIVNNDSIVWPCRMIKSMAEIAFLRRSGFANDKGFEAAVNRIGKGVTEKEVEIAMAKAFIENGALPSFMTITAGVNRYDMMNPYASEKVVIKKGDMVVMDFGCTYEGYFSDVTRGVFVGKPAPKATELYKAIRDVNAHALEAAKPGNPVNAIDAAAEKRIIELGFRDLMLHRTGHALGLEVHEIPSIAPTETEILQPGMVFAIEPGLYDYSIGGFRIENNIVITEKGYEYLTNSSQDIIIK